MSFAWQITDEDIMTVLAAHQSPSCIAEVMELVQKEENQIEKIVLAYVDFDDQCSAALAKIEEILIKKKIVNEPKLFLLP